LKEGTGNSSLILTRRDPTYDSNVSRYSYDTDVDVDVNDIEMIACQNNRKKFVVYLCILLYS
jgi:hypothetical protein